MQLSVLFLFLTESLELSKQLTRNAISQPIGTATTVNFSTHGMVLASRPSDAVCFCSAAEEKGFAQLVAYRKGSLKQLCDAMKDVWITYQDLGRVIQQTDKNDSLGRTLVNFNERNGAHSRHLAPTVERECLERFCLSAATWTVYQAQWTH